MNQHSNLATLDDAARAALIAAHPGWRHDPARDAMVRDYVFDDFASAFAFMTHVAILADKADHHPEWSNVYNRLTILWTTHDARRADGHLGGLSTRDAAMLAALDAIHP